MSDFKPSQVLIGVPPLVGTLGRSELEQAAAMIILTCQRLGDAWQAVSLEAVQETLCKLGSRPSLQRFLSNPSFRPDFEALTEAGFAEWRLAHSVVAGRGDGTLFLSSVIALTDKGLKAIRKWVGPGKDGEDVADETKSMRERFRAELREVARRLAAGDKDAKLSPEMRDLLAKDWNEGAEEYLRMDPWGDDPWGDAGERPDAGERLEARAKLEAVKGDLAEAKAELAEAKRQLAMVPTLEEQKKRPPELEALRIERDALLGKDTLTEEDERKLAALREKIGDLPYGHTPEDVHAMDVIRRAAIEIELRANVADEGKVVEVRRAAALLNSANARSITAWARKVYELACEKGWHDEKRPRGEELAIHLMNLHSEVSECWEAYRAGRLDQPCDKAERMREMGLRPLTCLEEELADIVIRVMDDAVALDVDLEAAMEAKHAYNASRSRRHGGKLA